MSLAGSSSAAAGPGEVLLAGPWPQEGPGSKGPKHWPRNKGHAGLGQHQLPPRVGPGGPGVSVSSFLCVKNWTGLSGLVRIGVGTALGTGRAGHSRHCLMFD